jgi:hypothetical protein
MDLFNDPFHVIALLAFVEVSREQGDWPDSETTRKRAYDEYERNTRNSIQ